MAKAGLRVWWTSATEPCENGQCSGIVLNQAYDQTRVLWVVRCEDHKVGETIETVWTSDLSDSPVMSEVA